MDFTKSIIPLALMGYWARAIIVKNTHVQVSRTIFVFLRDACHELFCVSEDFYASGMQDAEVTKSL